MLPLANFYVSTARISKSDHSQMRANLVLKRLVIRYVGGSNFNSFLVWSLLDPIKILNWQILNSNLNNNHLISSICQWYWNEHFEADNFYYVTSSSTLVPRIFANAILGFFFFFFFEVHALCCTQPTHKPFFLPVPGFDLTSSSNLVPWLFAFFFSFFIEPFSMYIYMLKLN